MRTLLLCVLCIAFVAAAVTDCGDKDDHRKVLMHAAGGLFAALVFWWLLAYKIGVFSPH